MLILFSQQILGLSGFGHGLLLTAEAAGGVLGGLIGPMIVARLGKTLSLALALVLIPPGFLAISLTATTAIVAFALFATMFAGLLWNVVTDSCRQRLIPDALLGRVNSIYRFFGWGMMPIGAVAAGAIVTLAEPHLGRELALRAPFALAALGCFGLLGYGAAKLRL